MILDYFFLKFKGGGGGAGGAGVKRTPLEKTALKKPSLIIRVNKTVFLATMLNEIFIAHISLTFCFEIQTFQNLKATYLEKSWLKHLIIFEEMKLMPVVMKNCY